MGLTWVFSGILDTGLLMGGSPIFEVVHFTLILEDKDVVMGKGMSCTDYVREGAHIMLPSVSSSSCV